MLSDVVFECVGIVCNALAWQPSDAEWQRAQSAIGAVEASRVARFKRAASGERGAAMLSGAQNDDARRSTVGRLLLQRLAAHALRVERATLARTDKGKPVVVNSAVHVSAAHDGALVVAVVGAVECGVDVVAMALRRAEPIDAFFAAFRDVFGACEWRLIRPHGAPVDQRAVDRFFVLWALKEAYVKATGDGIGFGLERLSFACDFGAELLPRTAELSVDGAQLPHWRFALSYAEASDDGVGVRWIADALTSVSERARTLYVVAHATTDAANVELAFQCVKADELC
jgi:4'-phosphopantetheinyl transferase